MSISDYTKLDDSIVRVVAGGTSQQNAICARLSDAAKPYIRGTAMTPNALIDSRLRTLKGVGRLRLDARGFSIPGAEPAQVPAAKTKADYTALDTLIVDAIKAGRIRFAGIVNWRSVNQAAAALCVVKRDRTQEEPWRIVDRRLQAMRKKGTLAFSSGASWSVPEVAK